MDTDDIKRKTEQFLSRDKDEELPEVIYHYCPFSAFVGILETGELWLSHQNSMNDLSEARWFLYLLHQEANQVATDDNRELLSSFLRNFELNLKDYFILSFSREPDILSQWVMYADGGRGVSIGFYTEPFQIEHRIPNYSLSSSTNHGMLGAVKSRFSFHGAAHMLHAVTRVNEFRNHYVAHQEKTLGEYQTALTELEHWVEALVMVSKALRS